MTESQTIFKIIYAKAKNRRAKIEVFKDENGKMVFDISAKRLIGDWRNREINSDYILFSEGSFFLIYDLINMLFADIDFTKEIDRFMADGRQSISLYSNLNPQP